MKMLARDDLILLRESLDDLMEFFLRLYDDEIPYFLRFVENMKNNLDICFLVNYEGWEQIGHILRRDWAAANHQLTGIPGFNICTDNQREKEELNCRFLELISTIERYLKKL